MSQVALDEDLEDYWRDLRPRLYCGSLSTLVKRSPPYLSLALPDGDTFELVSALMAAKLKTYQFTALKTIRAQLHQLIPADFMKKLVQKSVAESRAKCKALSRIAPMAQHLVTIHDLDMGPLGGAFDEEFVIQTLWGWANAFQDNGCGREERELLQLTEEEMALSVEEAQGKPHVIQTRLLHLLLLGGVYGVLPHTPMAIVIPKLEELVQTHLLTGVQRLARARQINTLLEELEHWNHHFSSFITVVLGWSGGAQDAILLRGLCEPLMQKIDASKCRLS